MKQAAKPFFFIYAIIVFSDLLFLQLRRDDLRWISKPLLMPLLTLAFYYGTPVKSGKLFYLILAALFLSWCGDVLLQAKGFFIPGLLSFLLAHVSYIIYFRQAGIPQNNAFQMPLSIILPVFLYIVLLLLILFPHLQQLKIPVIIYSLTIGTMLLMAIGTRHHLPPYVSSFFIAGTLLFVVSDSLLAINLFIAKHQVTGLAVMATYAAAQYLIVKGALVNVERYH